MSFEQTQNQLKKDGEPGAQSAQSKLQNEATEHTLAGAAIGVVRDVIPGLHGSAASNDQIAQIAADTVASLPMVKTVVGGAIRATMLIDPTKGFESNAGGFAVNCLEGAALNKVSRLAMPESAFATSLQSRFGTGLAAEATTHLVTGFGFGAIRTGFNGESWKDSAGNFDIRTGAENLIKGGATGALINLPAGMAGLRVARASTLALEGSIVTPRIASALAGIGSGYAAGGVYGGVDAVMSGKGFTDVLKGINEGGLIGAATGGVIGTFDKSGIMARPGSARTGEAGSEIVSKPITQPASEVSPMERNRARNRYDSEDSVDATTASGRLKVTPGMYDYLQIEGREVPKIKELSERLTSFTVQPEQHREFIPNSKGPWESQADFDSRATSVVTKDYRVYKMAGVDTEIALPEQYAKQLDEVRMLRLRAEKPSVLDDLPRGQSLSVQQMVKTNNVEVFQKYFDEKQAAEVIPIAWARIKLAEHPFGRRALPEDILSLLDEQPSTEKINRVNILPGDSPHNPWFEQMFGDKDFSAVATAVADDGIINFYRANNSDKTNSLYRDNLRAFFAHERGHIYTPSNRDYQDASLLDKNGHYVTEYSRKNDSERWSEDIARGFLDPDADKFLEFAEHAPVRAVVMARNIESQIENAAPADRGSKTEDIMKRVKFVEHNVTPLAREQLAQQVRSRDPELQRAALRLLQTYGTAKELDPILYVAHHSENPEIKQSAFDLAVSLQPTMKAKFDFVWNQGQPDMPARDLAIIQLRRYGNRNENAASLANLLEYAGARDLPNLAKQVNRMFTDEGSELAYDMAMKMGATVKGYQREVALSALIETPGLRTRALQTLNNQPPEGVAPVVARFVNDSDPEVAKLAQDVLRGVELRLQIAEMQRVFDKTGDVDSHVIDALGASGDTRSIPALLQVVMKGNDASRAHALDALGKFDPTLVKFQARAAKQGQSTIATQNLNYVMDYNRAHRAPESQDNYSY